MFLSAESMTSRRMAGSCSGTLGFRAATLGTWSSVTPGASTPPLALDHRSSAGPPVCFSPLTVTSSDRVRRVSSTAPGTHRPSFMSVGRAPLLPTPRPPHPFDLSGVRLVAPPILMAAPTPFAAIPANRKSERKSVPAFSHKGRPAPPYASRTRPRKRVANAFLNVSANAAHGSNGEPDLDCFITHSPMPGPLFDPYARDKLLNLQRRPGPHFEREVLVDRLNRLVETRGQADELHATPVCSDEPRKKGYVEPSFSPVRASEHALLF